MKRVNILWMAVVAMAGLVDRASADEVAVNRTWGGQLIFNAHAFGTAGVSGTRAVPGLLASSLNDVADDFTISSLTYANGGVDVNRTAKASEWVEFPPDDFPGVGVGKFLRHTLTLDRIEWLNGPTYAEVPPAELVFMSGDGWRANPELGDLESITFRFLGEYSLTLDDETVAEPFDVAVVVTPGELPQFNFYVGNNYPSTLHVAAYPSFGPFTNQQIQLQIAGLTRTANFGAAFRQVPEPGTLGMALLAGSLVCVRFARRVRR